jgi:ATP-dependent Clp protease ATP-binding subunit ClpA
MPDQARSSSTVEEAKMFERFTHRARRAVVLAQEEARSLKQSYIDTEHVLLGLLHQDDSTAVKALRLAGVDLARLRAKAREISGLGTYDLTSHIPFTRQTKTVLEKSLQEARGAGGDIVGTEHMLMALIDETRGGHTVALRSLGIDVVTLREAAVVQSGPPKKMTVIDSIAAELNLTSEAVLAIGQPELATRIRGLRRRLERAGEQDFSTKSKLAAIFISYRRRDSSHVAGHL